MWAMDGGVNNWALGGDGGGTCAGVASGVLWVVVLLIVCLDG
jgi:hypothetical protein